MTYDDDDLEIAVETAKDEIVAALGNVSSALSAIFYALLGLVVFAALAAGHYVGNF